MSRFATIARPNAAYRAPSMDSPTPTALLPRFLLAFVFAAARPAPDAAAGDVFYSFHDGTVGGVARVTVDDATGAIEDHRILGAAVALIAPEKFALTADRRWLLVASVHEGAGNLLLLDLASDAAAATEIEFESEPDEVVAIGERFVVGGSKGRVAVIDPAAASVVETWSARKKLEPSGHKPESIDVLPNGESVLVTFQKDSGEGKHLGSRIVVLAVPTLDVRADLAVPRDHEELHYTTAEREQGPNPELAFLDPRHDVLALTLDLYGAIRLSDLGAALEGRWENASTISAALDGSFGSAFPDRGARFDAAGRSLLIIVNAGEGGGATLIDLASRAVVQRVEAPRGLDTPVVQSKHRRLVSVGTGKRKSRGETELDRETEADHVVVTFEIDDEDGAPRLRAVQHELPEHTFGVAGVGADGRFVLIAAGDGKKADLLLVFDAERRDVVARTDAKGEVARLRAD